MITEITEKPIQLWLKDMEVSGKVTFVNTNDAEDHAMILGATMIS